MASVEPLPSLSLSFLICVRRVMRVTSQGGMPWQLLPMLLITFKELLFLLLTWVSPVGFFWLLDE